MNEVAVFQSLPLYDRLGFASFFLIVLFLVAIGLRAFSVELEGQPLSLLDALVVLPWLASCVYFGVWGLTHILVYLLGI